MKRIPTMDCPDGVQRAEIGFFKAVAAKTAAYTIVASDFGKLFTNRGATGSVTLTLPAATKKAGFYFGVMRVAAQNIVLTATGGAKINNGSANGSLTNANNGGFIVACDGTDWFTQTITVGAGTVTKAMMEDAARGSLLIGVADDAVGLLDAKGDGKILVGDGTDLASVAVSGDATLANTGAVTLGQIVTGAKVANVANANVIGGVPVVFRADLADASGDVDIVSTHKVRILDAVVRARGTNGANANTVQIFNGANALSDAMALQNKSSGDLIRAASLVVAQQDIAAGGTLKITSTKAGGDCTATIYITAIRVA